jgi:hypothetical protein
MQRGNPNKMIMNDIIARTWMRIKHRVPDNYQTNEIRWDVIT